MKKRALKLLVRFANFCGLLDIPQEKIDKYLKS